MSYNPFAGLEKISATPSFPSQTNIPKQTMYGTFDNSEISERQEQLNNKSENLRNCILDIDTIKNNSKLEEFDFSIIEGEFEGEVLNKIWGNYIKNPNENGEFDIEVDFSLAILETRNEILKECANIKTDSETYKVAIKNIESWDIEKQLEWIESLYILAYSNEWTLWKTTLDKYKRNKKKQLKSKFDKVKSELEVLEDIINKTKEQKNKEKKLTLEYNSIIRESQELLWEWDVFKASKLDLNTWNTEKQKED